MQIILLEKEMIVDNHPLTHITAINLWSTGIFDKFKSFEFIRIASKRGNRYQNSEKLTNIMNHFWKRWLTENVKNLRDYHKLRSLNNNST